MPTTQTDVDEHPIIFNDWSIRRILAGEKTQTRRVIDFSKFDPLGRMDMGADKFEFERLVDGRTAHFREPNGVAGVHCPFGAPGDVLWVREAFRLPAFNDGEETPKEQVERGMNCWYYEATDEYTHMPGTGDWGRKRPAIHMPRELCRLRLRVEDVRVERVQEISSQDVRCEGVDAGELRSIYSQRGWSTRATSDEELRFEQYVRAFEALWNDIHGDGAWERNDWVWVVTFSRMGSA